VESIKKVIVVGLDGLERKIVGPMLDEGLLPNLAKLKQAGGFSSVETTCPAQTPVAWSSFATGVNPGGHGIFDFIRRDPKRYLPDLALNKYEQKNAFLPPKAVNLRRGTTIWDVLTQASIPSTVLRCPCTYPPDKVRGRMLSGMGVPDIRGGLGTSTFITTKPGVKALESENVVNVQRDSSGVINTHLIGPRNPKDQSDCNFDISIAVDPSGQKVTIRSSGQPKELEVGLGQWSDWLRAKFKMGVLQSKRGMVRFLLVRTEPELELYVSPVNFDPDGLMFSISSPQHYASDLAKKIGLYYTTGMVEDHGGLNNERFDESAYLDHCADVMREREDMMLYELGRQKEGFFYCLFDTPDRLQHMFWRFGEDDHPANRGDVTQEMKQVIREHYQECDAVVGKAMEHADDQTLMVVMSDHGFNSFQRGVHLNTWLHDNGFLAFKNGIKPGPDTGDFFREVDWENTKAYALGLGSMYLNLKGREEKGIVDPDEAKSVTGAITEGMKGLVDPQRQEVAIRDVVTREQVYWGPYANESPDMVALFSGGYRVSWDTALGGVPEGHFEDNVKKWSGDHIIDPSLVPGVLFMNRPFKGDDARLIDLAPTILEGLGVDKGPAMEGASLLP